MSPAAMNKKTINKQQGSEATKAAKAKNKKEADLRSFTKSCENFSERRSDIVQTLDAIRRCVEETQKSLDSVLLKYEEAQKTDDEDVKLAWTGLKDQHEIWKKFGFSLAHVTEHL